MAQFAKKLILENTLIIGVDEVGRGCLAGPVYASAVYLRHTDNNSSFKDSKALSPKKRQEISQLVQVEHEFAIGIASVEEIDELNILQAALLAMKRAVEELMSKNTLLKEALVVIDGNQKIPNFSVQQRTVIGGDSVVPAISAASIVAKVARDQRMVEIAKEFPQYGFEVHKGYGTQAHRKAIAEHGPCVWHRRSFKGVEEHRLREISLDLLS